MKKSIDPNFESTKDAYFFAISLITPRPIAFITSLNESGSVNAAPFSYFNGISTKPPLFTVSIANKRKVLKDSAKNILREKEFCINFIDEPMAQAVTISAADFKEEESEMDYNGLTLEASELIKTPRIKESPAVLECKLKENLTHFGDFNLIIGEVMRYQVEEKLIDKETGYIKTKEAKFLGRLGGEDFCRLGEIITVKRKKVSEYNKIT